MPSRRSTPARGAVLRLAAGVATLLAGGVVRAQTQPVTGFAVDRFEPAGGGSDWLTLESLDLRGHMRPGAALVGDWAFRPLVIFDQNGREVAPLLRHQVMAHVDAALVLWDRLRLDVNLPVAVVQDGAGGAVNGQSYAPPPAGVGAGDLRLGADLRLYGRAHQRVTVAAGVQVFVPTGSTAAFTGDGRARVWPRLAAAGDAGPIAWAARLGYH